METVGGSSSAPLLNYSLLRPAGLEPATSWFEATRSIQLRYGRFDDEIMRCPVGQVNEQAADNWGYPLSSFWLAVRARPDRPVACEENRNGYALDLSGARHGGE